MVELVDTPDLGSGAERCEGSSPSEGTKWIGSSEAEQNPVKVEVEIS